MTESMSDGERLERWPGYDEQSWSQRFAELDRRYHAERQNSIKALLELHEARAAIESRVRAEERERAARIARSYEEGLSAPGCVSRDHPTDAYLTGVADAARAIEEAIRNGEG